MKKIENTSLCKEATFKKVYETHAQSLQNFLTYKYGSSPEVEDIVQDTFIKLWHNCKNVTLQKVKSYLFTLANNAKLNVIKHNKVILAYQQNQANISHTNESPEFLLEKEQYLKSYQKALNNLSEEQRVAFLLNKAEGKKHQEIADLLGVSRRVIEYRIYSAFEQLKKELSNFNI